MSPRRDVHTISSVPQNQPPAIPAIPVARESIQADAEGRIRAFQDIFGHLVMHARASALEQTVNRVVQPEARQQLGSVFRHPYEQAAALPIQSQKIALELTRAALDAFIRQLLTGLSNAGLDVRLDSGEAVQFPLQVRIVDPRSGTPLLTIPIAPDDGFLADRWGHWLNDPSMAKWMPPSS